MPTELQELVGFIAHPNPQLRKIAIENLVAYSTKEPSIFKTDQLLPVKHLKFLVRDDPVIAEHALTILINLSADRDVLECVATDDKFIDIVLQNISDPAEPNANLLSMLLANLAKWEGLKSIATKKQKPVQNLGSDDLVLNQLVDLFVKGMDGSYNKHADFDYLAYLFADLAKHSEIRQYFVTKQSYDDVIPLNKIKVFTEHKSDVRRKGVASTIKNAAFDVPSHKTFLDEDGINILPYILLPIVGGEPYDEDETMAMLPDLQLLPPDKQRDSDPNIIQTHVETLLLLTSTREGRDLMRSISVYPIIRETHTHVDNENVREACDRFVQVLMSDEQDEAAAKTGEIPDDERIEEV
ncbi:putative cytoplasm protein [Lasiosphaeria ovina]|uniref:Protein HGH1 homolog n=1 Tax=Lasiosphaeria ovina TaxID=92902 RepID=A0AAE0NEA5_9PEZI|nr:putative cytoplasm protein [Lasiosphaeria ovina]